MVIRKTVFIQLSFLDCSTVIKYLFFELSNLSANKKKQERQLLTSIILMDVYLMV